MLSHSGVWDGIDAIARRHGLSVSALAKLAGLDATAFNLSKRVNRDGRQRWPSTESLSKVLDVTGESIEAFVRNSGNYSQVPMPSLPSSVPMLGLAEAGAGGFFDSEGLPSGQGWNEVEMPAASAEGTYALEVSGDSMLPLYRDGDIIIVSLSAQPRRGDRVVVRTKRGEVMVKVLYRQTPKDLELHSLNPEHSNRVLDMSEIESIARIVWASQ